jgi:hypothetical protein
MQQEDLLKERVDLNDKLETQTPTLIPGEMFNYTRYKTKNSAQGAVLFVNIVLI